MLVNQIAIWHRELKIQGKIEINGVKQCSLFFFFTSFYTSCQYHEVGSIRQEVKQCTQRRFSMKRTGLGSTFISKFCSLKAPTSEAGVGEISPLCVSQFSLHTIPQRRPPLEAPQQEVGFACDLRPGSPISGPAPASGRVTCQPKMAAPWRV